MTPSAPGRWRETRDALFRTHPQSPLPAAEREDFEGLDYYDYDPAVRVLAEVKAAEPKGTRSERQATMAVIMHTPSPGSEGPPSSWGRVAIAGALLAGGVRRRCLPADRGRDQRNETYGAGRYVLDTVKGADLGTQDGRLVLDFNFAYNPSCSYDPAWVCPLATPSNRLRIPIRAGERHPSPPPAS